MFKKLTVQSPTPKNALRLYRYGFSKEVVECPGILLIKHAFLRHYSVLLLV